MRCKYRFEDNYGCIRCSRKDFMKIAWDWSEHLNREVYYDCQDCTEEDFSRRTETEQKEIIAWDRANTEYREKMEALFWATFDK